MKFPEKMCIKSHKKTGFHPLFRNNTLKECLRSFLDGGMER